MKLSLETRSANIIHSYEVGAVTIQQNQRQSGTEVDTDANPQQLLKITGSLIITPELLIQDWLKEALSLSKHDMQRVIEIQPEVILLGTGETMKFPNNEIMQLCYQEKIGIEVMNTAAACRTYNVLAAERRKVAAALMVV